MACSQNCIDKKSRFKEHFERCMIELPEIEKKTCTLKRRNHIRRKKGYSCKRKSSTCSSLSSSKNSSNVSEILQNNTTTQ